ncbi:MAG: hypothetical protein ACHQ4H_03625 [Ktedonobacterales bacterium]|jgi:hypothetical protein
MGKYKQWLHHQEIGRRLRDQINTYEQERGRIQKMAPVRATQLPATDNPIMAALLNYTQSGHRLSEIDVIKAAMPKLDPDLDPRRPAGRPATAAAGAPGAAPAANPNVVASLLARAEQMPSDPMGQLNELSRAREQGEAVRAPAPAAGAESPRADSMGGWWQRQRTSDEG